MGEAQPGVPQRRIVHADGLPAVEPVRPAPPVPPRQRAKPLRRGRVPDHVATASDAPEPHDAVPPDSNHRGGSARGGQPDSQTPPSGLCARRARVDRRVLHGPRGPYSELGTGITPRASRQAALRYRFTVGRCSLSCRNILSNRRLCQLALWVESAPSPVRRHEVRKYCDAGVSVGKAQSFTFRLVEVGPVVPRLGIGWLVIKVVACIADYRIRGEAGGGPARAGARYLLGRVPHHVLDEDHR